MFDKKFLDQHPLSTAHLLSMFKIKINETFDKGGNVPADIREELLAASMSPDRLLEVIEDNPCVLFEMFDEKNVHFYVYPYREEKEVHYLYANINDTTLGTSTFGYNTRKSAEKHAIRECFEMLEALLLSRIRVHDGKVVPDI